MVRGPSGQSSSLHGHIPPCLPSMDSVPLGGLGTALQLSAGEGVPQGLQTWLFASPSRGTVLTPPPLATSGNLAVGSPVSWGFPQGFALSSLQATGPCPMKGTVHTRGTWNALSKPGDGDTLSVMRKGGPLVLTL